MIIMIFSQKKTEMYYLTVLDVRELKWALLNQSQGASRVAFLL